MSLTVVIYIKKLHYDLVLEIGVRWDLNFLKRCHVTYICEYIHISLSTCIFQEFPYLRYRAAKSCSDVSTLTTLRDLVPTKLAALIWNCIAKYKSTIPDFPQKETCEFLIVDRSIDQVHFFLFFLQFDMPSCFLNSRLDICDNLIVELPDCPYYT